MVLTKAEVGTFWGSARTNGEGRGRRNGRAGSETTKYHCGVHFFILKKNKWYTLGLTES